MIWPSFGLTLSPLILVLSLFPPPLSSSALLSFLLLLPLPPRFLPPRVSSRSPPPPLFCRPLLLSLPLFSLTCAMCSSFLLWRCLFPFFYPLATGLPYHSPSRRRSAPLSVSLSQQRGVTSSLPSLPAPHFPPPCVSSNDTPLRPSSRRSHSTHLSTCDAPLTPVRVVQTTPPSGPHYTDPHLPTY